MKYIVIAGYKVNNITEFEQCIGIFDDVKIAYGEALLYLNDAIEGKGENVTISNLYKLEMDTGYGMRLVGVECDSVDFINVFFYDEKEFDGKYRCEL